jgi:hypothetical protein
MSALYDRTVPEDNIRLKFDLQKRFREIRSERLGCKCESEVKYRVCESPK